MCICVSAELWHPQRSWSSTLWSHHQAEWTQTTGQGPGPLDPGGGGQDLQGCGAPSLQAYHTLPVQWVAPDVILPDHKRSSVSGRGGGGRGGG